MLSGAARMLVDRGDLYEVKALSGKPSSPNFPMNGRFGTLGSCQFAFRLDVIFVFSNIIELRGLDFFKMVGTVY